MLLSPGHSPRHLSSPPPTPNPKSSFATQRPTTAIINNLSKSGKKDATVLDEDSYVAAIEKIIERDFFPDLSKLRDRLDWMEAIKTGDPVHIRDAQLKIMERRGKRAIDLRREDTVRETSTPGTNSVRRFTPFEFDKTPSVANFDGLDVGDGKMGIIDDDGAIDVSLSLDEFFRRYTSEDNDSFSKILEKVNKKRKERFGYLTEGEREDGKLLPGDDKMDRITDGYGTSNQPTSTLEGWSYAAKNLLMYPMDGEEVPLTEEERHVRMKGLTKEINRVNTRFHSKMIDSGPKDEDAVDVLYTPVAGATPVPPSGRDGDKLKKYDLEDLRRTPNPFYMESGKTAKNGYSFVRTPSPAPGVDESPFITWGEIEGTPLRLEPEDTPIDIGGTGDGAHFKIPFPPSRDLKAHSLSREAARKLRERSVGFQKPPFPQSVRRRSVSPSVRTLSPAAQKFVRNAMSKSSSSVDESLRASYQGRSPGLIIPNSGRSMSRIGRDMTVNSKSPAVREGSSPLW